MIARARATFLKVDLDGYLGCAAAVRDIEPPRGHAQHALGAFQVAPDKAELLNPDPQSDHIALALMCAAGLPGATVCWSRS